MKFKMDKEAHALYVELRPGAVKNTIEVEHGVYADVSASGELLGLEFVNADDFTKFLGESGSVGEFVDLEDLVTEELIQA